jgi:chemotaxis protein methyltransferase CheR
MELLPTLPTEELLRAEILPTPREVATSLYEQGRYAEAANTLLASLPEQAPDPQIFSLLTRALANQGKLTEALTWCDRWIAADRLDAVGHYVHAIVLLEHGDTEEARGSLQRAIYLRPDFVLAHFALGNLARRHLGEANRHFRNALHLLARHQPDAVLPESDGLTAGRLTETIIALTSLAQVA